MVVERCVGSVSLVALVIVMMMRSMLAEEVAGGDDGAVGSGVVVAGLAMTACDGTGEKDDGEVEVPARSMEAVAVAATGVLAAVEVCEVVVHPAVQDGRCFLRFPPK
jgi:hypothetical protein